MITGLCEHLGSETNVDAWIYRFIFIFLTFFSFGASAIIYLLLSWIVL